MLVVLDVDPPGEGRRGEDAVFRVGGLAAESDVRPGLQAAPGLGVRMMARGGWLVVVVRTASGLVAVPKALVRTTRKRAPWSSAETAGRV